MKQGQPHLIDTHCHIDFEDFDEDRDVIIQQAYELGVRDLIVPSVAQSSWLKTIKISEFYSQCHLALGLHPVFIEHHQPDHLAELDKMVQVHQPIAIGEIGLDFYGKNLDKEKQKLFFSKQLIIANKHSLPVIIHNRKAHDECITLLREFDVKRGIIHAFNGSVQQAEKYIELGFLLGFGGMLTFERSRKIRNLVARLPLENIVLETDAPDMTVKQHQGNRNSPHYLPYILQSLAEIKQISLPAAAKITTKNAKKLLTPLEYPLS
ncbi:MAG: TatD family hydrolase [Acidiferrobacterales bacterium]|nr:TatD family hydrolase [Acidiferrobacterales bacterium]